MPTPPVQRVSRIRSLYQRILEIAGGWGIESRETDSVDCCQVGVNPLDQEIEKIRSLVSELFAGDMPAKFAIKDGEGKVLRTAWIRKEPGRPNMTSIGIVDFSDLMGGRPLKFGFGVPIRGNQLEAIQFRGDLTDSDDGTARMRLIDPKLVPSPDEKLLELLKEFLDRGKPLPINAETGLNR